MRERIVGGGRRYGGKRGRECWTSEGRRNGLAIWVSGALWSQFKCHVDKRPVIILLQGLGFVGSNIVVARVTVRRIADLVRLTDRRVGEGVHGDFGGEGDGMTL